MGTRFVLHAAARGVDFRSSLMLGRQSINASAAELAQNLSSFGVPEAEAGAILREGDGYAEPFLRRLGAERITAMDASPFEGASLLHDLNDPLPDTLDGKFSCVIDGGTLEHVFNYPEALRSAMRMVEVGGHLLLITPTHRASGHGFYQLSPELFYRALSPANGYVVSEMLVCEDWRTAWYRVPDPDVGGRRVVINGEVASLLFVLAQRVEKTPIFARWPQQSDYASAWSESDSGARARPRDWRGLARRIAPAFVHAAWLRHLERDVFRAGSFDRVALTGVLPSRMNGT